MTVTAKLHFGNLMNNSKLSFTYYFIKIEITTYILFECNEIESIKYYVNINYEIVRRQLRNALSAKAITRKHTLARLQVRLA